MFPWNYANNISGNTRGAGPVHVGQLKGSLHLEQHLWTNGMWMVWTLLCAGMGCTNVAPANLGKKQNVIKRVSNCASCYRINSHHPTDHDRTLLRLQLHWLCGLRSSQNHRTLLEFICFAFGNNQWDVQSLSKLIIQNVCFLFDCLL